MKKITTISLVLIQILLLGYSGNQQVNGSSTDSYEYYEYEIDLQNEKTDQNQKENKQNKKGGGKQQITATAFNEYLWASPIIGQPTDNSITINIVPAQDLELYYKYGENSGNYTEQTKLLSVEANEPVESILENLKPNTCYYYQLHYKKPSESTYKTLSESTFMTQRSKESSFTFAVQGDSHPERGGKMFNADLYKQTMQNVADDQPDLYFTLGDDFSIEKLIEKDELSQEAVDKVYLLQRQFLGLIGDSTSLFLTNGNHEQAAKYLLDGTADNAAIYAGNARVNYYPLPAPNDFYSGDEEQVEHVGYLRDYYAFEWGDALFVVIDPYWHSEVAVDNVAGGGEKRKNLWDVTIGDKQYDWLKSTLEESDAKYKFMFSHHVLGTGRGGVEMADLYEWGGENQKGVDEFNKMRPSWEMPIHDLMVKNGVDVFFQGHDHLFAYQEKDGIIYQSVPNPADDTYTAFNQDAYLGDTLPNSGFLRITVSPDQAQVDYIRSFLAKDENISQQNGDIAYSYIINESGVSKNQNITSNTTQITENFSDVLILHQNYEAITWLKEHGIVNGYADNTFKPNNLINRAEALKIIILGSGLEGEKPSENPFPDVDKDEWFAPIVNTALIKEIVQGDQYGKFNPSQNINLAEVLKIILLTNEVNIDEIIVTSNPYADVDKDEWFAPYFQYALDNDLLDQSSSQNVNPATEITRGALAEIIYRVANLDDLSISNNVEKVPNVSKNITKPSTISTSIEGFSGNIILGRPKENSITANILSKQDLKIYLEYGTASGNYSQKTDTFNLTADEPLEIEMDDLKADTEYFYRLQFTSEDEFETSNEYSFQTPRTENNSFKFAIHADPHMDEQSSSEIYKQTLENTLAANPDFMIDLGDNFMTDKLPEKNADTIEARYLLMRDYYSLVTHSVPLYLVLGNHEGEAGWDFNDNRNNNLAELSFANRLSYYSNPFPDDFYTGNPEKEDGEFVENYYSFEWGDALIVVLDPFRYTDQKPKDGWTWTLGDDQYEWFQETLENSDAKYKFVFAHNLVGGDEQGRGGIEYANYYEWGGLNADGTEGFATKRSGWDKPIHDLLVDNEVDVFFHGHDHFFAKQELDGVIYQAVPQPSHPGDKVNTAEEYGYVSGKILGGSGFMLVDIDDDRAKIDFIKTYEGKPGEVVDSYEIQP